MTDVKIINIGSKEAPVYVSEASLNPASPEGRDFWEGVATGSIVLEDGVLDLLLKETDEEKKL